MANVSNIGVFRIHEMFLDIDNDGSEDGLCSLKGVVGLTLFNLRLEKLLRRGFRCKLIPGVSLGRYNETSDSYDGLIGQLQRGELDSLAMPVFYPLQDSNDTFSYSPLLAEDTMTIFSVYNTSTTTHVGDIFSMFSSVPFGLWVGFFVCFFIFALVSSVGGRLLHKAHSGIWMAICTFLEQDTHPDYYPSEARYFAILSTIVMAGLFFIMSYRGGCVSTDLVTIDPPVVVDSYDHIIENRIETGFGRITAEWEKFEMAPKGSKERKIFERSFECSMSADTFFNLLSGLASQKKVIIGRPIIARIAAMGNLAAPTWPSDCAPLVTSDPHAKKYSAVFAYNSKHVESELTIYGNTLTKWMSQHGLVNYAKSDIIIHSLLESLLGPNALPMSKRNMVYSHIMEFPSSDVVNIGLAQYRRLIVVMAISFVTALALIVVEGSVFECTAHFKPSRMRRIHQKKKILPRLTE